jgi:hypothetical protein
LRERNFRAASRITFVGTIRPVGCAVYRILQK